MPRAPALSFRVSRTPILRRQDFRRATIAPVALPPVAPHAACETTIEVQPHRRGVLRFEGVSIARPDPLGLVRSFRRIPLPASVLVLPKRYPLPKITLDGSRQYQLGGITLAAAIGESEEFVSLRDYRPTRAQLRQ